MDKTNIAVRQRPQKGGIAKIATHLFASKKRMAGSGEPAIQSIIRYD